MRTFTFTERGFTLAESIVAIALLATALLTLVHLIGMAAETSARARHTTFATVLASQKMEELLAETELVMSSTGVEFLDKSGAIVCGAAPPCSAMVYVRRWSIAAAPNSSDAVRVDVSVAHHQRRSRDARVVTVRARIRQ